MYIYMYIVRMKGVWAGKSQWRSQRVGFGLKTTPPLCQLLCIYKLTLDCRHHLRNSFATLHVALLCLHCLLVDVQVHGQCKWEWSML